jgi:anti-anti-sigma factor
MEFKIDTKEKFHAITIKEGNFSANMTEELGFRLLPLLQQDVKNVVLILKDTKNIEVAAGQALLKLQQSFYDQQASFVICELQPDVEDAFDKIGLLELMNVTPTESEAGDIVQMEEIERELLGGEE